MESPTSSALCSPPHPQAGNALPCSPAGSQPATAQSTGVLWCGLLPGCSCPEGRPSLKNPGSVSPRRAQASLRSHVCQVRDAVARAPVRAHISRNHIRAFLPALCHQTFFTVVWDVSPAISLSKNLCFLATCDWVSFCAICGHLGIFY